MKVQATVPTIRRLVRTATVAVLVAVPPLFIAYFLFVDGGFSHALPRAEALGFAPSMTPQRAAPERQTESHTCGLHVMRSLWPA